jgi:N-acetyl-gamma-glutamyl-phosphate reductase
MPEMEQLATELAGQNVNILFQPHVGPFDRGILSSVYCQPKKSIGTDKLNKLYQDFYADEQFVRICQSSPQLKDIAGTNYCHVYVTEAKGKIIAFSAIDNLVKGASGQAIQNMNIIFGIDETLGLE